MHSGGAGQGTFSGPAPFQPLTCAIPAAHLRQNCYLYAGFLLSLQKHSFIMLILNTPISRATLKEYAAHTFGDMIKCVADVEKGLLAIDADLHADLERMLLENGSQLTFLWGFNLYPDEMGDDFIEFDSLINIRSWQGNPSRDVLDQDVRKKITTIVDKMITE
jgi:hypothetical protein